MSVPGVMEKKDHCLLSDSNDGSPFTGSQPKSTLYTLSLPTMTELVNSMLKRAVGIGTSLFRSAVVLELLEVAPPEHSNCTDWRRYYPLVFSILVHAAIVMALIFFSMYHMTPPYFQAYAVIYSRFSTSYSLNTTYHVLNGRSRAYRYGYYNNEMTILLCLNTFLALMVLFGSAWQAIYIMSS